MTPIVITRRDWVFIAVANLIALGIALISAKDALGWQTAALSVGLELVMLAVFCLRHPEPLFARLLVFGLAVGFTELLNDTYLIDRDILVYWPGGPYVWKTPLYMPLSWALIMVSSGMVSVWLYQTLGPVKAVAGVIILSALYIPGFEAMAAKADWWHYQHVRMYRNLAPDFVILGEALLAIPLPWMSVTLARKGFGVAVGLGVVEGLVVFATTLFSLWLVGTP